jgi:hypothetical protein
LLLLQLRSKIVFFLIMLVISQSNDAGTRKNGKKLVDAVERNTHNAPRNADEGNAKKRWLRSSAG